MQDPDDSGQSRSTPRLLMPWVNIFPPLYQLCKIGRSLSSMKKIFKHKYIFIFLQSRLFVKSAVPKCDASSIRSAYFLWTFALEIHSFCHQIWYWLYSMIKFIYTFMVISNKQRVLMHRHQGWNVRHGLCHIYMRYLYIYELFIAFVCFVVCSLL